MSLPYQLELEIQNDFGHPVYRTSIRELPGCGATVGASVSVEKLWRLLEEINTSGQRNGLREVKKYPPPKCGR
jgi:hypothetical protein